MTVHNDTRQQGRFTDTHYYTQPTDTPAQAATMRAYTICLLLIKIWIINGEEEKKLPFEVENFEHHPGIYFEEIGKLNIIESFWKIVIKIDISPIEKRTEQIEEYILKTQNICTMLHLTNKGSCQNYNTIIENNYQRLKHLTKRINALYKAQDTKTKRGLIDGIGTIAKTLFGTMDNEDRKLINEQLSILDNKQQTTEHIIKNQIKIINATIAHISNHEEIIQNNENILANAIKKLEIRNDANNGNK
ncbi:hypothetical protein P5V15_011443 [Pogonomyrmex californicus]